LAVGGFDRGASPDWLLVAGTAFPRRPRALQQEGSLLGVEQKVKRRLRPRRTLATTSVFGGTDLR